MDSCRAATSISGLILVLFTSTLFGQMAPFFEDAIPRGVTHFTYNSSTFGYGMGLDDLDGDGDPDLIAAGRELGQVCVYENDGTGYFTDRTSGSGLPFSLYFTGVSLGDYDGDGDLDLYLSGHSIPDLLLRNDGSFVFTDVTDSAGLGNLGKANGAVWTDQNLDGWLDLYVSNFDLEGDINDVEHPNRFYRNMGDGTFIEISEELGIEDPRPAHQAMFLDADRDGDRDLYVSNDKGSQSPEIIWNRMWCAEGTEFIDVSATSGSGISIDSMGMDAGDLDMDGYFDIYCSNLANPALPGNNVLLCGSSELSYTDKTLEAQVEGGGICWGVRFVDFDNDGFEELYVLATDQPARFYNCDGVFPCEDIAPEVNLALSQYYPGVQAASYCVVSGDIDLDGDLDLVTQSANEPLSIFINQEGTNRNSLRLTLRDQAPNVHAIGALVRITTAVGIQWRELRGAGAYKSSPELALTIGIGDQQFADEVLIRWPDGDLSILEALEAGSSTIVDRSQIRSFADCNHNFISDITDIANDPGLDIDGNGVIDTCTRFLRGDSNGDLTLNIADVITALDALFGPIPSLCDVATDSNDDSLLNIADPIYLLGHLFSGGPLPPAPNISCGTDPTSPGALPCTTLPACP
jgi:hypothetical protein